MSAPTEAPSDFVCWSPSEDSKPVIVAAMTAQDAAKVHALREQATALRHDNAWSSTSVLVVDYMTGDVSWFTVKVTVEASQ